MSKANADMLFETSWEVCNKVGGIYTVVKSKVELMLENYKEYFLVGPYFEEKTRLETQQVVVPDNLKRIFDRLAEEGIVCYFGKWLIKGKPQVILLGTQGLVNQKDNIKKWLWEEYGIDTLFSNWDFEEPMIWAYAVGKLLQYIGEEYHDKKIVAHFHEWLAGIALLYLKKANSPIKTVFTTHATMLGRSIAGNGGDLYSMLDTLDPDKTAKELGVSDKFLTERACAQTAEVFTTVSEITAIEAEKILGRRADVLVLNGLDIQKFPNFEECSIKHQESRDIIREFLSYYFLPYYTIDMEQTLLLFIVGRYEFKNKGIDIFIKALGRLNEKLKKEGCRKTIVAFFWIPTGVNGIRTELLESADKYEQIREFVSRNLPSVKTRLINQILLKSDLENAELFSDEFMLEARQHMMRFGIDGSVPLSTHYLHDENKDATQQGFRAEGLLNREEDVVKVIQYPVYLDGHDNLLGLKYYDALQGCHFGIFPSYYEPWGYTPLESAALGVPALTTDLAGFGRYIKKKIKDLDKDDEGGIFILDRLNKPDDKVVEKFVKVLKMFVSLRKKDRVEQKIVAKELCEYADWKVMIDNYINAHNLALER